MNTMDFTKRSAAVACQISGAALVAALMATPALAQSPAEPHPVIVEGASPQEAASDNASSLDEIVVTAQRRTQRLQDVPVAVSVVSGATLESANLKTLGDLAARLPNVKIAPGALVDFINIRGVGSGNNAGFEQSVATFLDGVYRARSRATRAALFDIDQIEVLKGPQTTFFGANAIAGALNITSKKPGDEFAANLQALYGDDGEYNLEGGVSVPLSDVLSVRVAGRFSGMDGFVDVGTDGAGPDTRSEQGRIAIRYEPTENYRSDFRFDAGRSRTNNAFPFELVGCPPAAPFVTTATTTCGRFLAYAAGQPIDSTLNGHSDQTPTYSNYDFREAAWTNSFQLGSFTLTAITGYFDHEATDRVNQVPFPINSPVVLGYDGQPLSSNEKYNQFSQEVRLQSVTGGLIEYAVGAYASKSELEYRRVAGFFFNAFGAVPAVAATGTVASDPISARTNLFEDSRTLSGFGSMTIRPLPALRVNLGLRYSTVRKEADRVSIFGVSANADPDTFQALPFATQVALSRVIRTDLGQFPDPTRTDDAFMPSAGVQYDFTPAVMGYASYSRGFKAGGFNANSLALAFGPETVDAYELGVKSTFFDRALTVNAAAFLSDYTDLQETTLVFTSGVPTSLVDNAAGSRAQGIELNATLRVSPHVTLTTDLAYLDSKYTDYANGACTILGGVTGCLSQDMSGKRRPYAPESSGNFGANFKIPLGDEVLSIDPLVYFSSRYFQSATADPLLEQDSFTKVDLRLAYGPSDRRWEIAVVGKNLTDEMTASFRQPVTGSNGSIAAVTERGRAIALQLSARW